MLMFCLRRGRLKLVMLLALCCLVLSVLFHWVRRSDYVKVFRQGSAGTGIRIRTHFSLYPDMMRSVLASKAKKIDLEVTFDAEDMQSEAKDRQIEPEDRKTEEDKRIKEENTKTEVEDKQIEDKDERNKEDKQIEGKDKQVEEKDKQIEGKSKQIEGKSKQIEGKSKQIEENDKQIEGKGKQTEGKNKQTEGKSKKAESISKKTKSKTKQIKPKHLKTGSRDKKTETGRHSKGDKTSDDKTKRTVLNLNGTTSKIQHQGKHPDQTVTPRPRSCNGCFNSEFPMLIDEPHLCEVHNQQKIDIIFLIVTSPKGPHKRNALRQTWVSVTRNNTSSYRHVFLLGRSRDDKQMEQVRKESDEFRDVLVSDFVDSYNNLTLKTLMGLRWASTRCRHARFFLKVDDDVWVNTSTLMRTVTREEKVLQHNLGGPCQNRSLIHRNPHSKWYVSKRLLPYRFYPPKCLGLAYFAGMNVAAKVAAISKNVPFFEIEDVYVGFCLEALGYGVRRVGFSAYKADSFKVCHIKNEFIAAHGVSPENMKVYWKKECS